MVAGKQVTAGGWFLLTADTALAVPVTGGRGGPF